MFLVSIVLLSLSTDRQVSFLSIKVDGWMTCNLASSSTVFQLYEDDDRVIMKGYVQWNFVYGSKDFRL